MTRHLMKLVWNRKRGNMLIMAEITISFLVLFAVVVLVAYYADNYRRPLGFDYERVWVIEIERQAAMEDPWTPELVETTRQIHLALAELPEIESSAGAFTMPYQSSGSYSSTSIGGRDHEYELDEVTDDFVSVMNLNVVKGRWFGREDDGANVRPVVLNEKFAAEAFGDEDPIGKILGDGHSGDAKGESRNSQRVIGVVSDFRKQGEFAAPGNFAFVRSVVNDPGSRPASNIAIKVRAGTTAVFEEKLVRQLQAVAKNWTFRVSTLDGLRDDWFRMWLTPLAVAGLVAGFLMLMVALGLTGVLWQNVTRRTSEIGLRRVQGASIRDIYAQIVGELVLVATLALLLGVLVVVQIPLLDVIGGVPTRVFGWSIAISLGLVYLLTVACGLYPSWLATRVEPVQALRYE